DNTPTTTLVGAVATAAGAALTESETDEKLGTDNAVTAPVEPPEPTTPAGDNPCTNSGAGPNDEDLSPAPLLLLVRPLDALAPSAAGANDDGLPPSKATPLCRLPDEPGCGPAGDPVDEDPESALLGDPDDPLPRFCGPSVASEPLNTPVEPDTDVLTPRKAGT